MATPKLKPRTEKRCPGCETVKPLDEFYKNRSTADGYGCYCKPCHKRVVERGNFRSTGRGYHRNSHLKRTYGITIDDYNAMVQKSSDRCWACGEHEIARHPKTGTLFALAVDHDHDTGEVRGLLCFNCNKNIRSVGDDRARLMALVRYLDERSPIGGTE